MPYKDEAQHVAYRLKRRADTLAWLRELKIQSGCTDCKYNAHHAGLQFDHLADKEFNISHMLNFSRKRIQSELDKCEVVCGTCHGVRTFNRLQN